jgi:hypothetical protein
LWNINDLFLSLIYLFLYISNLLGLPLSLSLFRSLRCLVIIQSFLKLCFLIRIFVKLSFLVQMLMNVARDLQLFLVFFFIVVATFTVLI